MFANSRDFGKLFTVKHKRVWVVFDEQVEQLRERKRMHTALHVRNFAFVYEYVHNFLVTQLLWRICNAFMQVLAKITINKNLFNKVTSFWLHFITKRDIVCEQVEQQTSQTELKHISVVGLSDVTPQNSAQYNFWNDFCCGFQSEVYWNRNMLSMT